MSETKTRPPIPLPIKRQVRRECYFGCVICGAPLFDYDHIIEYSVVLEHTVENITLLCRTHHADKTSGRLSVNRVLEARKEPYNGKRSVSTPYKIEPGKEVVVKVGDNLISPSFQRDGRFHAVWLNGVSMFTILVSEGWMTFSMKVTNETGNTMFSANEGEIQVTTNAYDYTYEGRTIKIWQQSRHVLFEAEISDEGVHIKKGCFVDSHGDGFMVNDPWVIELVAGKQCGFNVGATIGMGPKFGGFGFANKDHFDQKLLVDGFAIMRMVGYQ